MGSVTGSGQSWKKKGADAQTRVVIGKAPGRTVSIDNSQTRGAVERLALVGDGSQTPVLMNGKVSNLNHIVWQDIGEIAFLLSRALKREVLAKTLPAFGTAKNLVMIN
jgi:hypothetical protein